MAEWLFCTRESQLPAWAGMTFIDESNWCKDVTYNVSKIHQAYLRSGMIHVSIFVLSIIVYFEMEDETFGVTLGCHMFEINALLLIKIFL